MHAQVEKILGRLSRLDVVAENVAHINFTLKEAARRNKAEDVSSTTPQNLPRPRPRSRGGQFADSLAA